MNLKLVGGVLVAAAAAAGAWVKYSERPPDAPFVELRAPEEAAPLCPWREPEKDLHAFFPTANRTATETRILSADRLELIRRLGRNPLPEETALQLYQVYGGAQPLGSVVARRVKGEFGAIEVVVAVSADGKVRGVRLQRLREPESAARALTSPAWLGRFRRRSADEEWNEGALLAPLPVEARTSGKEIVEGVRSTLILRDTALRHGLAHVHEQTP